MTTELVLPPGVIDRRTAVELRAPKASTVPTRFVSPTLAQVEEWDAEAAWRLGVIANVVAYRCVQIRANAGATVPLVAGRRYGDAATINDNAPITRLLGPPPGGPAPRLSARKLLRWTLAQEIVTGRRAWEIETEDPTNHDAPPIALWPLASAHLRAHPSKSGAEWFRLFEFGPAHDPVRLRPDQVFYGWDSAGVDFRQAESALQAARYDLTLVNLCDRYGIGFLRNNAVPATIITTTAFPNEAAKRAFRSAWEAEYGGPENAGRVAIHEVDADGDGPVGDTIDVKQLGLSAKDARLADTRKDAMSEIAIALGVPWSKLDASGRTYDNAEAEDRAFYEETVLPDLIDLADDINMQLAPRLGSDVVWFDVRAVPALARRIRPVTQSVGAPALVQARIMTFNEARADYGLTPIDGYDRVITDAELATMQGAGGGEGGLRALFAAIDARSVEAPPSPPALPEPPPAPAPEPLAERTPEPAEDRAPDPEATEARRALYWRTTDAVLTQLESRWVRVLRRFFDRQADATVSRLTGKRGRQALRYTTDGVPDGTREPAESVDAGAVFDSAFWTLATVEVVGELYEAAMAAAVDRVALMFATSFDLAAEWVTNFIQTRANQLAGHVTQTTYDAIVAELVAGVELGESIDDLATRVRSVFATASQTRAVTIARTEVISAYNGAAVASAEELPRDVVFAQEWIATRDGRTREAHASADGQVVLIGEPFTVAGHSAAYPGDPALPASQTVNCRCAVAFLTPDDYEELGRAKPLAVDHRVAKSLVAMVPFGDDFDVLRFRRALEGIAL